MLRRSLLVQVATLRLTSRASSSLRHASICRVPCSYINNRFVRQYSEVNRSSTFGNGIPTEVADLSLQKYHNEADKYLDNLLDQLELLSENHPKEIPDIELNHGVMTLEVEKLGSYLINKQPPNKQIWLASPVSGPDRFDFYQNEWISLRNGHKLSDVLKAELLEVLPDVIIEL